MISTLISSKSNESSSNILLCNHCQGVPELKLISPVELAFKCDCSNQGIISIDNALNLLSTQTQVQSCSNINHRNVSTLQYCVQCKRWLCGKCIQIHQNDVNNKHHSLSQTEINIPSNCKDHNIKVFCYCKTCRCNLCYKCLNNHSTHQVEKFKSLKKQINLNSIVSQFMQTKQKIEKDYKRIKNDIIEELQGKIEKVEKAYLRNKERNEKLCSFVSMIIKSFELTKNIPNYQIVKNLLDNTHFNKKSFERSVNYNELKMDSKVKACQDYFDNNYVIKCTKMNLSSTIYTNTKINCALLLNDKTLACGTSNNTVNIYNTKSHSLIDTLLGHEGTINNITELDDHRLVTSSADKTIKIWKKELSGYKCQATLQGHTCSVSKTIQIPNNRIASCSYDTTIRIWSTVAPFDCLAVLKGHRREVTSILLLKDGRLVSNSLDSNNVLLFWDLNSFKAEEHKVKGLGISGERNRMVQMDDDRIILDNTNNQSYYQKEMIYIVNVKTYQIEKVIKIDNEYIKTFFIVPNKSLYIGCDKGIIIEYDIISKQSTKKICHKGFISDILIDSNSNLLSCSNKGEIKLWN